MAWSIEEIRTRFLDYMVAHGHVVIEGHSVLSPTDDVLFTTAGMHPLTPYLMGETHPAGKRLCDVQRCVRTTDVDEVGDNTHLTVFEMLGNWSLGDYFKDTAIPQSFAFLIDDLELDPAKLYVTVFAGDGDIPPDPDAPRIWTDTFESVGVDPAGRINPLGADDNWWANGPTGPCGPDTEMFVYVGTEEKPTFADVPEFVEIWNNVFMTFERHEDGSLTELSQRNVDTGMGLERICMFLNRHSSVWQTDELAAMVAGVAAALGVDPAALDAAGTRSIRIVADHVRAALVIAAAGIRPSASRQGYVLRKLIRRAVRHSELLTGTDEHLTETMAAVCDAVSTVMGKRWPDIGASEEGDRARETVLAEAKKFAKTLKKATEFLEEQAEATAPFDGAMAFRMADTLGMPAELAAEEAERLGMTVVVGWEPVYDELREAQRARSRG
jgi:alanyl-tRNA synthetase